MLSDAKAPHWPLDSLQTDQIANPDLATFENRAIQAGAMLHEIANRLSCDQIQITARRVQSPAFQQGRAHPEPAPNQMVQRNIPRGKVAPMFVGREFNGMVAQQGDQRFVLDQRHLADVRQGLIGPQCGCIAVTCDTNSWHQSRRQT